MSALLGVPIAAAYHIVLALTLLLAPLPGGLAAVIAIVVITAAFRLLVMPLTFRALRGQAVQARLAPHVRRLRERYGRQPERFQRELAALYRREGASPFAGFAPLLAQWPVFSVLFLLFNSAVVAGGPNKLLAQSLFGVPLGSHWLSLGLLSWHGAVFAAVLAVLAVACWLVVRAARRLSAGSAQGAAAGPLAFISRLLPYVTVAFAAFAPLAVGIYLIVSTGWSAAERFAFAARNTPPGSGVTPGDQAGKEKTLAR